MYGLVTVASIEHPLTKTTYFWLGAVHKWRFVLARGPPGGAHAKAE